MSHILDGLARPAPTGGVPYPPCDGTQPCTGNPRLFEHRKTRHPADIAAAKARCNICPFQAPCLNYALASGEPGIWGGMTEKERADERAARRKASWYKEQL